MMRMRIESIVVGLNEHGFLEPPIIPLVSMFIAGVILIVAIVLSVMLLKKVGQSNPTESMHNSFRRICSRVCMFKY